MSRKTVLVIDDDDSLRRVIEFTLHEAGYRVVVATDGEEGLRIFALEKTAVVITDIQMPGISGYDLLREIKEKCPETLVIVITAFATVEKAVEAMKIGAYDFITKPFSRDELRLVVDKAMAFKGLQEENTELKKKLSTKVLTSIVGTSDRMQSVLEMARRVAASEATVLIFGESGTGKELIARGVHHGSDRSQRPFVPVNCAAIPSELLESELFGHVKGAFTGAVKNRQGKFEMADGGTLFLDEVGELPVALQPKLLRALQEREIEPVGGSPRKVDVRIVAATNRDIEAAIAKGTFREDLYYRLAVVPLHLPPLRQRREDIPLLVKQFLKKYGKGNDLIVDEAATDCLIAYDWPGNVCELENAVEWMLVMRRSNTIEERDLPPHIRQSNRGATLDALNLPPAGYSLEALERDAIVDALVRNDWIQTKAAAFLQIPRHVLIYRMKKYHIARQDKVLPTRH